MIAARPATSASQHVHQRDAARHRQTGVARAGFAEADRVPGAADDRSMQQQGVAAATTTRIGKLRRHDAAEIALAERRETTPGSRSSSRAFGDPFGDARETAPRPSVTISGGTEPRDQQRR